MGELLTSPLDVVTARLKLAETNPTVFTEKTMSSAAKAIYRMQGVRGFFNGLTTHMLHTALEKSVLPFKTVSDEYFDSNCKR